MKCGQRCKRWAMVCLALALCGGLSYYALSSVRLRKLGYRHNPGCAIGDAALAGIETRCRYDGDAVDLILRCNDAVCAQLSFSYRNDVGHGKANCVGYAVLAAEALNRAFRRNSLPYHARPVYGKAYLWGIDLHPLMQAVFPSKYAPFFRDHDFVEIDLGDRYVYADASMQDVLGYGYIECQKK